MSTTYLDTEDTGDVTYDGPTPYHQPAPRRRRALTWWWGSAVVSTALFLVVAAAGTQYAAVEGARDNDPTWNIYRGLSLTLLLASVAAWHALFQAKLILRCSRREREALQRIAAQVEVVAAGVKMLCSEHHAAHDQGFVEGFAQAARAKATGRVDGRTLRSIDP